MPQSGKTFPRPTFQFTDGETESRETNGESKNTQGIGSGLRECTAEFIWKKQKNEWNTHTLVNFTVVVKEVIPSAARVS